MRDKDRFAEFTKTGTGRLRAIGAFWVIALVFWTAQPTKASNQLSSHHPTLEELRQEIEQLQLIIGGSATNETPEMVCKFKLSSFTAHARASRHGHSIDPPGFFDDLTPRHVEQLFPNAFNPCYLSQLESRHLQDFCQSEDVAPIEGSSIQIPELSANLVQHLVSSSSKPPQSHESSSGEPIPGLKVQFVWDSPKTEMPHDFCPDGSSTISSSESSSNEAQNSRLKHNSTAFWSSRSSFFTSAEQPLTFAIYRCCRIQMPTP